MPYNNNKKNLSAAAHCAQERKRKKEEEKGTFNSFNAGPSLQAPVAGLFRNLQPCQTVYEMPNYMRCPIWLVKNKLHMNCRELSHLWHGVN